jgi:hypothetical protein
MAGADTSCSDVLATVARIDRRLAREKDNDVVVELIRELQAVDMTYEVLEATKIGHTVNALRKSAPTALARLLADTLYRQWKVLANEWITSNTTQQQQPPPPPNADTDSNKRSSSSLPPKAVDDKATNKPSSSPRPASPVDAEQSARPEPDHEKSAPTTISAAPVRKNILRFRMVTVKEPGKLDRCRLMIIPSEAPDPAPASNYATQNGGDNRQQAYCTATTSHQATNADNKGVYPSDNVPLTRTVKSPTALPNPVASPGTCNKRKGEAPTDFDEERLAKARVRHHEGYKAASVAKEKRKTKLVNVKEPEKPDHHRLTIIPLEASDPAPASNDATQNGGDSRQQAYCAATASHQTTNADNKGVYLTGDSPLTMVIKPPTALANHVASSGACKKRKGKAPADFDEEMLAKARVRLHEGYKEASAAKEKRKTKQVNIQESGKPDQRRLTIISSEALDPASASNDATQNGGDSTQQAYCAATASHQTTNADNKSVYPTVDSPLTMVVKPPTALANPVASSGACKKRKAEAPTDFDEERLAKAMVRLHEGYKAASAAKEKGKTKHIDVIDAPPPEKARQRPTGHRAGKKQVPMA